MIIEKKDNSSKVLISGDNKHNKLALKNKSISNTSNPVEADLLSELASTDDGMIKNIAIGQEQGSAVIHNNTGEHLYM